MHIRDVVNCGGDFRIPFGSRRCLGGSDVLGAFFVQDDLCYVAETSRQQR
jgi:hypothetical protein